MVFVGLYIVSCNCFDEAELLRKQKLKFSSSELVLVPPTGLLLTIPRRYFCCGSSVLHVMSVCIRSSAKWSPE